MSGRHRTRLAPRVPRLVVGAALFAALVFLMPSTAPFFAWAFPGVAPPVYQSESFPTLVLAHAWLVAASSAVSATVGVGLGIVATRQGGRELRAIVGAIATIGQTMPPVAVLALAVPALGYGTAPTMVALALYGLLPVVENTLAGLDGVAPDIVEAARGIGLSSGQVLLRVELPLAAPAIVAGIRTSVIINIGTATIGSTIGAVTLGSPIIDGLVSDLLPYVLQGAVIVAALAILVDAAFEPLERSVRRQPVGD
jgi:osmoprotectant transport system permease protein